jgi:hypothetical protein
MAAFKGINGNFNPAVTFGKKPEETAKPVVEKETAAENTPVVEQKQVEASALKGLAAQGKAQIASNLHAEDIKACKELAAFLPAELAAGVNKHLTPLNIASVTKNVQEAQAGLNRVHLDEARIAENAAKLFASPAFQKLDELFS